MYKVVLMFTKVAVVCLYYRIFAQGSKPFRISCHIVNAWIVVTGMAFIIATLFQCTPIPLFWDKSLTGWCYKNEPWWISYSIIQILTDFLLMGMPIRRILSLSMGRAEKLGIGLVFATGAL